MDSATIVRTRSDAHHEGLHPDAERIMNVGRNGCENFMNKVPFMAGLCKGIAKSTFGGVYEQGR
jgi:hypothetical protein